MAAAAGNENSIYRITSSLKEQSGRNSRWMEGKAERIHCCVGGFQNTLAIACIDTVTIIVFVVIAAVAIVKTHVLAETTNIRYRREGGGGGGGCGDVWIEDRE